MANKINVSGSLTVQTHVAEKQSAYCQCFCKSGCRFSFPAEDRETHWTAQLWAFVQPVCLMEKWRRNSGQGGGVLSATEEPWVEEWWRSGVGEEGSPEGTSPLKENCRGS